MKLMKSLTLKGTLTLTLNDSEMIFYSFIDNFRNFYRYTLLESCNFQMLQTFSYYLSTRTYIHTINPFMYNVVKWPNIL